jgi:hypothetical protein
MSKEEEKPGYCTARKLPVISCKAIFHTISIQSTNKEPTNPIMHS